MLGFIHITKTGGTNIKDKNRNKEIVYGDFHSENAELYKKKGMKCFAIVREPVERYCSLFYYNSHGSDKYSKHFNDMNINDFVNHHYVDKSIANFEDGCQFRKQVSWLNNADLNETFLIQYHKEHLIDTIREFCKSINIDFIYENMNKINQTNYKNCADLTEESIKKIKEMYQEDCLLYEKLLKVNTPFCKMSQIT